MTVARYVILDTSFVLGSAAVKSRPAPGPAMVPLSCGLDEISAFAAGDPADVVLAYQPLDLPFWLIRRPRRRRAAVILGAP